MTCPPEVRIVEVGPRDGLQNEQWIIPVRQRIALIDALSASGLQTIEAGSFVSPKRVPQMAGSDEVLRGIARAPGVSYPVLVPNAIGMEHAIRAGADEVALFLSATESFSQRNINCSIAQSLERAETVIAMARRHSILVRGYVSCVLGCPYEGAVKPSAVADLAERLVAMGCYEISLGDTIGVGTPRQAQAMVQTVSHAVPLHRIAIHFHDTHGQALSNVLACIDEGVAIVDAAAGGLGGCPYATGASGNLATEDLLYMLDGLGVATGVDMEALLDAVALVENRFGVAARSKVFAARRRRSAARSEGQDRSSDSDATPLSRAG
ncbi:hydroxymethylglutaryl-CoA lyase [Sphingomonas sp. MG17]|jgi:hydroxymethylglutaryl-CoA lyase|uniref:hydroxymethylglutaryl-CoA lyase n=1 Tax=Sphingomonas tagetis TaxID=2949092 RepID=A0A9X2KM68_9SPHN|nr:hydroxymethylglutaryl-CoA lyase [Sphingomonas tagetis]MCP3731141.1 hydroxymethylglutaryl-CoA lyase [Sphingomonas tagetis]